MKIVTRFAPSPTGYLHIGSARTALFNYLFSKNTGGKFLLRIEDTDKARSTQESVDVILDSLKWLGIDWDEEPIFQSERQKRHEEIAHKLVKDGKAYYCFCSKEEIDNQRQDAIEKNESFIFKSPWRDLGHEHHPNDIKPVVRLKVEKEGNIVLNDLVQGQVTVENSVIDDMVLLRSDGTPTYMLAVVVDDHDMGVTHIIRGDDHLNNAFRQIKIFEACGFEVPQMGHIPLIQAPDGTKLSKRHGAIGANQYREMGYLPEALFNYLLRLGWSHGDDEIISKENAIKWFDVSSIGKSPSRIDFAKMKNLNAHYIREADNQRLFEILKIFLEKNNIELDKKSETNIISAMNSIKTRSSLIDDLVNLALIYHDSDLYQISEDAKDEISKIDNDFINSIILLIQKIEDFSQEKIQDSLKAFANQKNIKLGELMNPIRVMLTGQKSSPSVFELIAIIGKEATIRRLSKFMLG